MDKIPVRMTTQDRQRLTAAVAKMAIAIDTGACEPTRAELQAMAAACDEAHLHVEAGRVRRWLEP